MADTMAEHMKRYKMPLQPDFCSPHLRKPSILVGQIRSRPPKHKLDLKLLV